MSKSKKYPEWVIKMLKNHDEAIAYLNAASEECRNGDEDSQQLFLVALRNVAEAKGWTSS